jgi:hypothetical protein
MGARGMISAARKLQSVGFAVLLLLILGMIYPLSLQVATTRSDVLQVERQILRTRENIRYLETELGARASMRQLERWNAEVFGYSAPTAGQYLAGEQALANLEGRKSGKALPVVAPVLTAMATGPSTDTEAQTLVQERAPPQGLAIAQQVDAPKPQPVAMVMAAQTRPAAVRPALVRAAPKSVAIIAQANAATVRPKTASSSAIAKPKSIASSAQARRDTRSAMLEERLISPSTLAQIQRGAAREAATTAPKTAAKITPKPNVVKSAAAKPASAQKAAVKAPKP